MSEEVPKGAITIQELVAFARMTPEEQFQHLLKMRDEAFGLNVPLPTSITVQEFRSSDWRDKVIRRTCHLWTRDGREVLQVTHEDDKYLIHWIADNELLNETVDEAFQLYTVYHPWTIAGESQPRDPMHFTEFEGKQYLCFGSWLGRRLDLRRETNEWGRLIGCDETGDTYLVKLDSGVKVMLSYHYAREVFNL